MKSFGIAVVSAGVGLLVGATALYLFLTVFQMSMPLGPILAVVLALLASFAVAAVLGNQTSSVGSSVLATLVVFPLFLGSCLACGFLWTVLSALVSGG